MAHIESTSLRSASRKPGAIELDGGGTTGCNDGFTGELITGADRTWVGQKFAYQSNRSCKPRGPRLNRIDIANGGHDEYFGI